jgi:hypothetical protein
MQQIKILKMDKILMIKMFLKTKMVKHIQNPMVYRINQLKFFKLILSMFIERNRFI